MLVLGIILELLILTVQNSNACEKSEDSCCLNYYRKGDECKECPLGTHGVNCSGKCLSGYYGRFCLEACKCPSHLCDAVNGCPKNNTTVSSSTGCQNGIIFGETCKCSGGSCDCFQEITASPQSSNTSPYVTPLSADKSVWLKIFFTLMGSTLMVLAAAGLIYLNSWKKKRSQAGYFPETAIAVEQNQQTESSATIDIPPQIDGDRNIYADIRSSQMMECQSYVLSKRNYMPIQSEEVETDLINRNDKDHMNILSANSCGRSKENEIIKDEKKGNDYGIFEESCQYSVLSLRRNFDPSEMECFALKQSLRRQFSHNNDDPYCLTNVWLSEGNHSLDDFDSDSDISYASQKSDNASNKSKGSQSNI